MSADVIFFPRRKTLIEAVKEAMDYRREPGCKLATDGQQVAWLPRIIPGWFAIDAAVLKVAA